MANSADLNRIRKAKNRECSALILAAISAGHRYRLTRSNGVLLYGPQGTATAHLDGSDHRNARNFRSALRGAGITT